MRVVALSLAPDNLAILERICAGESLLLETVLDATPRDDSGGPLLACIEQVAPGEKPKLSPEATEASGAYSILVLSSVVPSDILSAVEEGFTTYFLSPLSEPQVRRYIAYLKDVGPPRVSQKVILDGLTLRVESRSPGTVLLPAEARVLELLASRAGRIVPRAELSEAVPDDLVRIVTQLRQKLREIDSHAKILKVPHIGFRFVGSLDA